MGRDEQWRVQALYINPDCVEYAPGQWLSRAKYSAATGFLPKNKHAYLFELGPIGEIQDEHMGEREKIVGVTKDGTSVTLYCQLAHPCTVGSLNRHSLAWGLPFMVPKEMLDSYTNKLNYNNGNERIWDSIATLLWSDAWAKGDKNAASAKKNS